MASHKLTEAQRADIARRYAAGESTGALAREYGVAGNSVLYAVRTRGGEARAHGTRSSRAPTSLSDRLRAELSAAGERLAQAQREYEQIDAAVRAIEAIDGPVARLVSARG